MSELSKVPKLLTSPRLRALYLSDVFESFCPELVGEALRDVEASCRKTNVVSIQPSGDMSLDEVLRILHGAGLELVALPRCRRKDKTLD